MKFKEAYDRGSIHYTLCGKCGKKALNKESDKFWAVWRKTGGAPPQKKT